MPLRHCPTCNQDTRHRHMHDCAHGIPETHMHGTERFECAACGRPTFVHSMLIRLPHTNAESH